MNPIHVQPERDITPDAWVILKISDGKDDVVKVLSGFNGGYLNSNSWRLSSSVIDVAEHEKGYHLVTDTGSTYMLHHNRIGFASESRMYYENIKRMVDNDPSYSCILGDKPIIAKELLGL